VTDKLNERQHVVNQEAGAAPDWSSAGAAFTRVLMRTFPLERRLSAAGEALAQLAGQTLARWMVLEAIDPGPATVADVGRAMGQARQGVQRLADLLVADGLATYEDNPRHARAKLLTMTPTGRNTLRVVQRAQRSWADRIGRRVGQQPLEQAEVILDAMLAAVTEDMPDTGTA
jgi:DNA-binding MarR family transcriptional regulator